jgi:hypothetical protein
MKSKKIIKKLIVKTLRNIGIVDPDDINRIWETSRKEILSSMYKATDRVVSDAIEKTSRKYEL